MTYVPRSVALLLLFMALWLWQPVVYAQDSQTPLIDIVKVDTNQAPSIQISVVGGNLPGDLSTLPIKLFEGDKEQAITADQTRLAGSQLALVIDPHNISAAGASGQIHHAEVAGAALDLIENKVITRNVDLLAVYSLKSDGGLQTIQNWTKEPNLIFNSVVQNKPEEVSANLQLTGLLVQVLDKFPSQTPPLARSLLLFSAGASQFDLAKIVAKAREHNVYIDTVEMAAPNQAAGQATALQQLAQQTHGRYVFFTADQNLAGLWTLLAGFRTQRTLAYKSSSAAPAPLRLQFTLPDHSTIQTNFQPSIKATGAVKPAQVLTTTAPAAVAQVATATVASAAPVDGAAAAQAPVTSNAPAVDVNQTDRVMLPGIGLAVPRVALQLALPVLILLLAYFVYRDIRERRARTAQPQGFNLKRNNKERRYELSDPVGDLKPLPKSRANAGNYALHTDEHGQIQVVEPVPQPRRTIHTVAEDQNDEATIAPRPAFGDDEATYRLSEQIEQPVVGYFVRVAGNPTLPNELPIYGLSPARGEARQIHIGRHSKNNTVVINDKSISREHAVIIQKEGRLYLRDNASTAGTFLNGKRLQPGEELLLRHNNLVSFGEVTYEFHAKGEDEITVAGNSEA